ncbi:MAG: insulinase family protein [Chloroflexi bacterium]|nr:insulinase family protein [Chloroflexota bacterium]
MYEKTTLTNGLRVLTVPMPQVRSVSIAFYLGAGSRYEIEEKAGLSHFVEHMLFKGTRRRPKAQQISETIDGIGGFMNAGTDREITSYWAKVARPHLPIALDLLSDMLLESLFEPDEMERERKVILEEISSINDSPAQRVDLLIDEVLWPGQPLGRDVGGTKESVGALTRSDLLEYMAKQYAPNNAVVAVAGDLVHDEVVSAVQGHLDGWARSQPLSWFPSVNGQTAPQTRLKWQKTEQAHLCIAFRGLSAHHPDRYALDLLNVILGEGMSSRLSLELRERQGLCYDVHSYPTAFQDAGSLNLYAGVDPANATKTLEALLRELRRFRDEDVPEEELERAKAVSKGRLFLRMEDTRAVSDWLGAQELMIGSVRTVDEVAELIDAVSPADVRKVAQRILVTEHLNLAVVGPFRSDRRFRSILSL